MAKSKDNQIIFRIANVTPERLSSAKLAQYLADLATLLGSQDHLHFSRVGKGSASLIHYADPSAIPRMRRRVDSIPNVGGEDDARTAYARINSRLAEDEANGYLKIGNVKVLKFRGRQEEPQRIFGRIVQDEYLDGQLVRVGGLDETVPVHLREADRAPYFCSTDIETAKSLGPYLYGQTIRVFGTAHWIREGNGNWKLERFQVHRFKPLNDASLAEAVNELRSIPTNEWDEQIADEVNFRLDAYGHGIP